MHTAKLLDSQVGPGVASESWRCLGPAEFENSVCGGTPTILNRAGGEGGINIHRLYFATNNGKFLL